MSDVIPRLNEALTGRYAIERELGSGGMATVYLAHDERHDRKVAVKVLRPDLAAVMGADRFLTEIRTTANLQHPHILPLFDSGEADGFLFYVMPYVEGETLQGRMDREKQLPVEDVVYLGTAIAGALDSAHRQGVIHRDIKPANILLHDGQPLVADFGIALAVQQAGGGRLTETGLSLGTPHYMSPEQATADRDPDARSDVYSLACVVYEMLTGEPPFPGSTAQAVLGKIITAEPTPPTDHRKSIPLHLEAVILKALEKLPADRFESAAEFADALKNPAIGQTLMTRGLSGGVSEGRPSRAVPVLVLSTVLLATAALWGWLRPMPEAPVSRYQVVLPADQTITAAREYALSMMPDGSGLVYAGEDAAGDLRLWFRRWDQLRATPIDGTEGARNPSPSPDGSRIAFVTPTTPRTLRAVSSAGGGAFTVTDSAVDMGGVSWGDDGYIYFDGRLEGDGVARVRETGGSPEVVSIPNVDADERFHFEPFALPGGAGVLFTITASDVLSADDFAIGGLTVPGEPHRVLVREGHTPKYAESGHLLFVRDDQIMAAPFDIETLQVTGPEVPVVAGIESRALGRSDYAVSSQGHLAYAVGAGFEGGFSLVGVGRDGGARRLDVDLSGLVTSVELSPDGTRAVIGVAEEDEMQLWVVDLPDGSPQRLTFTGAINRDPAWSPNGETIVFSSYRNDEWGLYEIPSDGSGGDRQVFDVINLPDLESTRMVLAPSYTRDGEWIVLRRGGRGMYAFPVGQDSAVVSFPLEAGAMHYDPRVSPDGQWLAYSSTETGRPEVYVRSFPEVEGGTKRLISRSGGMQPRWSFDGTELFYVGSDEYVYTVDVTSGDTFQFGAPTRLFSRAEVSFAPPGADWDVYPQADRFLLFSAEDAPSNEGLVIVENFFAELREKVGN